MTLTKQERNPTAPGDYRYSCPICGHDMVVTVKPDDKRLLFCYGPSCSGTSWVLELVYRLDADSLDDVKENFQRYLAPYSPRSSPRRQSRGEVAAIPSLSDLGRFERRLRSSPELQAYLIGRGLTPGGWREWWLGYAMPGEIDDVYSQYGAFTIPVDGPRGTVNVRRRFWPELPFKINRTTGKRKEVKYVGLTDRGSQIYPERPRGQREYVMEGEFDTLVMRRHGFDTAITSTAGTVWKHEWDRLLRGREAVVLWDPEGLEKARRLIERWRAQGIDAWAVDLTVLGLGPKQDVTDYFNAGGSASELRRAIREAR